MSKIEALRKQWTHLAEPKSAACEGCIRMPGSFVARMKNGAKLMVGIKPCAKCLARREKARAVHREWLRVVKRSGRDASIKRRDLLLAGVVTPLPRRRGIRAAIERLRNAVRAPRKLTALMAMATALRPTR